MLGPHDPLPAEPLRVLVAGVSGVGKTTLALRIARAIDAPHTEIDALFHGPGWTPRKSFLDDVDAFSSEDRWVTEWQYGSVRPLLAARADTLVWLDLPFPVALWRIVRRTVRRSVRRETLWNGNVEPPLRTFFTDREHVIRWALTTRKRVRAEVLALGPEHPALGVIRLRSQHDVDDWLAHLA